MAKRYARINWQNKPSAATPVNAVNLNILDKGIDDNDNAIENLFGYLATYYNAAATYAAGQYCIQNNSLYRCTTPITVPEVWNTSHWTATNVGTEFKGVNDNLALSLGDNVKIRYGVVYASFNNGVYTLTIPNDYTNMPTVLAQTVSESSDYVVVGCNPTSATTVKVGARKLSDGTLPTDSFYIRYITIGV